MTDEELENLDLIIERQVEFVEWLKERGMYNPMETAETMQKMHRVWLESSRSPDCYAKFRRGDPVCVYMNGIETLGKFVGIDADGIITYQTGDPVEYLTAWDCNVYSA
jgi:hypothetical protein